MLGPRTSCIANLRYGILKNMLSECSVVHSHQNISTNFYQSNFYHSAIFLVFLSQLLFFNLGENFWIVYLYNDSLPTLNYQLNESGIEVLNAKDKLEILKKIIYLL